MGMGIMVCGLNGCGKSTLGKALAKEMGFHFIDNESLYFSESYENPRSRDEAERLLLKEVREHSDFVFAAVKGNYGDEILSLYDFIVLIEVPREIRLDRIRIRSLQKLGDRILPGGDLYEQEEGFFRMVESRPEDYVENWAKTLSCPIIKVDGTKFIKDNVASIIEQIYL